MPHLAASLRRIFTPAALAVSMDRSASSWASWDSDTTVMARICPAWPSFTSTVSPGLGGTSDFQTPSRQNQYCRPSIISRPGPVGESRRIFPRFFILFRANQGKRMQLYECSPSAKLFRIRSHAFVLPSSRWLAVLSFRIARSVRKNRHAATKFSAHTWIWAEGVGSDNEGKRSSRPTLQPGLRGVAPAGFERQARRSEQHA